MFCSPHQGSDEGSSSQLFDSSDNHSLLKSSSTEDSASSSAGGDAPQPLLLPSVTTQSQDPFASLARPLVAAPQERTKMGGRTMPTSAVNLLNQFDPFNTAASPAPMPSSATLPSRNSKSGQPSKMDADLSDFDPFSSYTPPSSTYPSPFPVNDVLLNNNKPMGAKPKTRTPAAGGRTNMLQPQTIGDSSSSLFHSNQGFDDNFTRPPMVQRVNPFDLVDTNLARVNHGFFEPEGGARQGGGGGGGNQNIDPFQPDLINPFSNPPSASSTSPFGTATSFSSTTKANGSAFHGLGAAPDNLSRSDSGVVSNSSSSQEHLSQRTDSSGSSGNASFLTSSQDSAKMPDVTSQNGDQNWSTLERPDRLVGQHAASTSSLGMLPSASTDSDKTPNGGFRSQSVDSSVSISAETLALYGDKLLVSMIFVKTFQD